MATPSQILAQIDTASTHNVVHILQSITVDATYDAHYVVGIAHPYAGRSRWCTTTSANTAAQQATEITSALTA